MFDTKEDFYSNSVRVLDVLNGLSSSVQKTSYIVYCVTILSLFISNIILVCYRIFWIQWSAIKSLVYCYTICYTLSVTLFTMVACLDYFRQNNKKNTLLTDIELLRRHTEKETISKFVPRFTRLWKLKATVSQYAHAGFFIVYESYKIYSKIKHHTTNLLPMPSFVILHLMYLYAGLTNVSVCYSFVITHIHCLELFLKMTKDFEEASDPMYVTLRFGEIHQNRRRVVSLPTISGHSEEPKDGKFGQLRNLHSCFWTLENAFLLNNNYHSFSISCLLLIEAIYIPTIPFISKNSINATQFHQVFVCAVSFFMIIQSVVGLAIAGDCYSYKKNVLKTSLTKKVYLNTNRHIRKSIKNMILLVSDTTNSLAWKCFPLDNSLISLTMDTAVLIFTTFFGDLQLVYRQ